MRKGSNLYFLNGDYFFIYFLEQRFSSCGSRTSRRGEGCREAFLGGPEFFQKSIKQIVINKQVLQQGKSIITLYERNNKRWNTRYFKYSKFQVITYLFKISSIYSKFEKGSQNSKYISSYSENLEFKISSRYLSIQKLSQNSKYSKFQGTQNSM